MNGLLHRLAARAAGTAALVRSDARLAYGGGTLAWADSPEAGSGRFAATREAMAPADAPPPARRGDQPDGREPGPLPGSERPTAAGGPLDVVSPGLARAPTDGAEPALALRRERPLLEPTAAASVVDAALFQPTPEAPSSGHRRSLRAAPFEPAADAGTRGAPSPGEPAPLLPPVADRPAPGVALAPVGRRAMAGPQAPAGAADEAGEVHIHIGRIDVTAVREAAPPRRRQVATPAPMSLDTYLARRSRR